MINQADRRNIDNFLRNYYANDQENSFNSLPRYFGGSLSREKEKFYERSKSQSAWFNSGSSTDYDYDPDDRFSNFYTKHMQPREEKFCQISGAHSERPMPRPGQILTCHRPEFYGDGENHAETVCSSSDPNYFSRKSGKNASNSNKFFRYTSIRSIKKLVNKLKGKKKFEFPQLAAGRPVSSLSSRSAHEFDAEVALDNPIYDDRKAVEFSSRDILERGGTAVDVKSRTISNDSSYGLRYQPNSYNLTAQHRTLSGLALGAASDDTPTDRSSLSNYSKTTFPASQTANFKSYCNFAPTNNIHGNLINNSCFNGNCANGASSGSNTTGSYANSDGFTPALTGITNHGNTCYINAVLQCLSNNDQLAEYFLNNNYMPDLRLGQKNAEKYGSHGQVTKSLADFIHALWFKQLTPEISLNFKQIVERFSEQYQGTQQQDAQEFFIWILDRVHEDLNAGVKRRYKLNKTRNKSEDEIACAAMDKHLEAHSSFISYQFHGLFLSSVTCPVCDKQSSQSDPFACVSLPVSQSTKKPLYVVMVFFNRKPRIIRFGLNADVTANFSEVKQCLSKATDVPVGQIVLCELSIGGFVQSFADDSEISSLNSTKCLHAFETPPLYSTNNAEEIVCLVCSQVADGNLDRRFGTPVAIKVDRELTYGELCRSILAAIKNQLKPNLTIQNVPLDAFRLRVADDYHLLSYIPHDVSLPLFSHVVDNVLSGQRKNAGPSHVKIMVEWNLNDNDRFLNCGDDMVVEHKSAQDLKQQEAYPESQTLHECLRDFTQDEYLQWYCPDCRKSQEKAFKRTLFYWLPNILTLHLKRNKQLSNGQLVKLEPLVKFPVYGLDLTEFTHQSSPVTPRRSQAAMLGFNKTAKSRNGELYVDTTNGRNVYDLFAVCNHHGDSPNSGHYTAYCRNPVNGYWYCFDDKNVTRMEEGRLVSSAAYMLFYEKRNSRNIASSCHNSTESGFVDHWFFKIHSAHANPSNGSEQQSPTSATLRSADCESREKLQGIDAKNENSPERPASRQMFVALPPKQQMEKLHPSENGQFHQKMAVGPLISVENSDFTRNIQIDGNDRQKPEISTKNQPTNQRPAIYPFSNVDSFKRNFFSPERACTNSLVETDL